MIRIGIFLPGKTSFYDSLLQGMIQGLNSFNVEVFGDVCLYPEERFASFQKQFKPDIVFEMNRTRRQAPFIPKSIVHIAWIVDTNGLPDKVFQDSQIIYFFGGNWLRAHENKSHALIDVLSPGLCPNHYFPTDKPVFQTDFSFIGHIPLPWDEAELARPVTKRVGATLRFNNLVAALNKKLIKIDDTGFTNDLYLELSEEIARDLGYELRAAELDTVMRYDLGCRAIRNFYRHRLIDLVLLQHNYKIKIFGPDNWRQWAEYAPFHHGILHGYKSIREVYQTSKINLHEGVGLHFRTFDCLASGGVLFFMEGYDNDRHDGIQSVFEPFVHYVPFDKGNFHSTAERYLRDDKLRCNISRAASQEAITKHSWQKRWEKILRDIKLL